MPPFDSPFPVAAESAASPIGSVVSAPPQRHQLSFSGQGGEYFRVWIVNLLLTLLTLGLYAPWAKVRKTRYFWRHTTLDGHGFEYHGNPWAILRGRLIGLVALAVYLGPGDMPAVLEVLLLMGLMLAVPVFGLLAQRLALGNTSWRGVRFGFDASLSMTYRQFRLPLALLLLAAVASMLAKADQIRPTTLLGALLAMPSLLALLLVPWMHHRLKAFHHGFARWGDAKFGYRSEPGDFYIFYLGALALLFLSGCWSCCPWRSSSIRCGRGRLRTAL